MISDIGHKLELYVPFNFASTAASGLNCLDCFVVTPTGERGTFDSVMQSAAVDSSDARLVATPVEEKRPPYLVRDDGLAYGQDPTRHQTKHVHAVIPYKGPLGTDIDLVVYVCSLPTLVTAFHSTFLMNIITANMCFSLFPRETVFGRLGLAIQSPIVCQDSVRSKYTSYGVSMVSNAVEACTLGAFKPGRRSIQDGNIACISMITLAQNIANSVDDEFRSSAFDLTFHGDLTGHAVMTCLERKGYDDLRKEKFTSRNTQ
ncbi:hypothetical protein ONZ45_g11277 [Pleurotus djamor]|nr:hypothetical protein ONZ45_g11277 [Pleurotus djamor]